MAIMSEYRSNAKDIIMPYRLHPTALASIQTHFHPIPAETTRTKVLSWADECFTTGFVSPIIQDLRSISHIVQRWKVRERETGAAPAGGSFNISKLGFGWCMGSVKFMI